MPYRVRQEGQTLGGLPGPNVVLEDEAGTTRAEIAVAFGFNCYRWQVQDPEAGLLDLLYADAEHFAAKPTRTGIPILFPFPNRIRDGRFPWAGHTYQLPCNDPAGKNAIHGFACRRPWRLLDQGADENSAWVTGVFQASVDAPDARALWPADYRLQVTHRLSKEGLTLSARVDNPDQVPLPFGLGYHPYVRIPFVPGEDGNEYQVRVAATSYWVLQESLPIGERRPLAEFPGGDLSEPQRYATLNVDNVLTGLERPGPDLLTPFGSVTTPSGRLTVQLVAASSFRELVVYTPPHRQAFALEPYTCTTDAINLQQQGIDAGLRVLDPGRSWQAVVGLRVRPRTG